VHKNFWGIKKRFTYEQITAVQGLNSADAQIAISGRFKHSHIKLINISNSNKEILPVYIYAGKKRINISEESCGKEVFLKFLQNRYRQLHNGDDIPQIHKAKEKKQFDIFNGNLKEPNQMIVAFIVMNAGVSVLGLFLFLISVFDPGAFPKMDTQKRVLLIILPTLFCLIPTILWTIVGRYAHKIPRSIVRFFYKEENLNIKK